MEPAVRETVEGPVIIGGESPPPSPNLTPHPPPPSEITVTPEFEGALRVVESGAPFIYITGRAGTGKSTFVALLKERLKSYAVVAPTGVAALNVGGQTIHSFFRFPPTPIDLTKIRPVRNRIAYQALRTLIIDEISMVRADLLDAIDVFLQKNGPKLGEPFGGVQVIAVGDLFQLPPVVASEEEHVFIEKGYGTPFFFSARCLSGVPLQRIEFSRIFRQTEASFIELLNNLREGKKLDEVLGALSVRVLPCPDDGHHRIVLTATNNIADRLNTERLHAIVGQSRRYTGTITGEFKIDRNKLPAPLELELRVGAQVMFVRNDPGKRWVNGTIGVVRELEPDGVVVEVESLLGARLFRAEREKWQTFEFRYDADLNEVKAHEIGSYEQIPLTLAWAVTIHKSQGKTFERVHINLGHGAFAPGQVYVALSRCRTLDGITLERPITRTDIHLNLDVINFHNDPSARGPGPGMPGVGR